MVSNSFSRLEIEISKGTLRGYSLAMRFLACGSDADNRSESFPFELDTMTLQGFLNGREIIEYGLALTVQVFAEKRAKESFIEYIARAQSLGYPLMIRIACNAQSFELHEIVWEALCNPENNQLLTTDENVWFSRYLPSQDRRPVSQPTLKRIRAVVAVSNPHNLEKYHFSRVDVDGETGRAKQSIGAISTSILPQKQRHTTLQNIIDEIQVGVEIVYLACHGFIKDGETFLVLEDAQGGYCGVKGSDLVLEIKKLTNPPRLMVLASCESAGKEQAGALLALGPLLAQQAGVPAVLAMHGKISMETVKDFAPAFFNQLQKDGQIDRALAVARNTVRNHFDFWMPVLFLRSESGKLWDTNSAVKESRLEQIKFLPYLINRTQQYEYINQLVDQFDSESPKPIVAIVHGDSTQCHDEFIRIIKHKTLPNLLKVNEEFIREKKINLGRINDSGDFSQKFLKALGKEFTRNPNASKAEIQNALADTLKPTILVTSIGTESWVNTGYEIIYEYLKFWQAWPVLKQNQYIFAFLLLDYKDYSNYISFPHIIYKLFYQYWYKFHNRKIKTYLQTTSFRKEFDKIACYVLPELTNVVFEDVRPWVYDEAVIDYLSDHQRAINQIESIYKEKGKLDDGLPMLDVSELLTCLLDPSACRKGENKT